MDTRRILPLFLLLLLAACRNPSASPIPPVASATGVAAYPPPGGTLAYPAPSAPAPSGYPAPTDTAQPPYPAPGGEQISTDPQDLSFVSEDGLALAGTYYPSSTANSPLVLLMHQFGRSRADWVELAHWMQNGSSPGAYTSGVLANRAFKYDWFPPMPAGLSLAVFSFDFRGHGGSAGPSESFDAAGFLMDARAALAFARALPGIDPQRIITIGASIGADAAVDVCLSIDDFEIDDEQEGQGCIGALSLSPGNFLGVDYVAAITRLGQAPHAVTVHCLAAEADANAPELCRAEVGAYKTHTIYPGSDHGFALIEDGRDPNVGQVILDFLLQALDLQ